jgi:hypothetical protein
LFASATSKTLIHRVKETKKTSKYSYQLAKRQGLPELRQQTENIPTASHGSAPLPPNRSPMLDFLNTTLFVIIDGKVLHFKETLL